MRKGIFHLAFVVCHLSLAIATACAEDKPLWDMAELSKAPAFEWVDDKSAVRSLLYEGPAYKDSAKTRVFAYYASPGTLANDPALDKDLPAVVLVHGGGGFAFPEWVDMWAKRGYAAIAFDMAGIRPKEGRTPHSPRDRIRMSDGGPDQQDADKFDAVGGEVTDDWVYHSITNTIRAHSLIRTMPGVDANRTAITGISWGGYLTCIAASVDDRFKAAVPVYGCGFVHEGAPWAKHFERIGPEKSTLWAKLYDPSSYLPKCKVPIFFVNGTNDFAYPLDIYMKSYELVKCEKHIRIEANMKHSHPDGWAPREIGDFIDWKIKGGPAIPSATLTPEAVRFESPAGPIKQIMLVHTVENKPIHTRAWTQTAVPAGDGKADSARIATDKLVPADATAWFYTMTDERGVMVSSPVMFAKPKPAEGAAP